MRALLAATLLFVSGCYDFSIFSESDPAIDLGHAIDSATMPTGFIPLATTPGLQELYGVWGTSENNVYAVGDNALLSRWNGTAWTPENVSALNGSMVLLEGISGRSASDIWVVGEMGTALHSSGTGVWTKFDTGTDGEFFGVWVNSDGTAIAVGANGTVIRFDPTTQLWDDETAMAGATDGLIAVAGGGVGADAVVVAVGSSGNLVRARVGSLPLWDAPQIVDGSNDIDSVWSDGTNVLVGGSGGEALRSLNGAAFTDTMSPVQADGRSLFAMWGPSASSVFAVGLNGAIIHWNGTVWAIDNTAMTMSDLRAIWGDASGAFIVGEDGLVLHKTF